MATVGRGSGGDLAGRSIPCGTADPATVRIGRNALRAASGRPLADHRGTRRIDRRLDSDTGGTRAPCPGRAAGRFAPPSPGHRQPIHSRLPRTLARLPGADARGDRQRHRRRTRAAGGRCVSRPGGRTWRRPETLPSRRHATRTTGSAAFRIPARAFPPRNASGRTVGRAIGVAAAPDSAAGRPGLPRLGAGVRRSERRLARRPRPRSAAARPIPAPANSRNAALRPRDARSRHAVAVARPRRCRARDARPTRP